jgi:pyruvate dehydrogenase E2 component (dihydrolipoamide acetyltransferase)
MAEALTMPKVGHVMEEGTVLTWVKQVGDRVEKGDIVLEIEMDKAAFEVESFVSGTLLEILVGEGETVKVGTPLATIG